LKNGKLKKILLGILKLLYYIVIAFVCIIAGILIYYIISVQIHSKDENYVPGISIYTIVSPSMTPNINVYDVVVNVKASKPSDIEVGDIITFKSQAATSEGMTITHRVIAIDQLPDGTYEYMTQGDNNPEPDSSYVTFDNIIGKEILTIPGLGKVQFLIANKKSWLFLLLIPITIYLIKEIFKLIDLLGLKKKVNKVIGHEEEKPAIDKEKQEALKEQLKKDLFESHKQDIKNDKNANNNGFLNNYSEIIEKQEVIEEIPETTKRAVIAPSKPIIKEETNKVVENTGEIILPRIKEYEVLDTSDIEIKESSYLEGTKIKVVGVEETKNKKKSKMLEPKKEVEDDGKINLSKDTTIPNKNPHMRVERPLSKDIQEIRKDTKIESKNKLNLNPNRPKKINRNKNNNKKKQLNLNPNKRKKINRYNQYNTITQNKTNKTKPRLIVIEKVKKED
jgi:signal peptidase